jgi:hypothetical protein
MKAVMVTYWFIVMALVLMPIKALAQLPSPNPSNPPAASDYIEFKNDVDENDVDIVTVGSRMPYKVESNLTPGINVEFKWKFSFPSTILSVNGSSPATGSIHPGPDSADWFHNKEVSIVMPSTIGNHTVTNGIRYVVGNTVMCANQDVIEEIRVIARPTIKWTASTAELAICIGDDALIDVTLISGVATPRYEIQYTIAYNPAFTGGSFTDKTGHVNAWMLPNSTDNGMLFPAAIFDAAGIYRITINNITDRISRKSLNMDLVKAQAVDLPATYYEVQVMPALPAIELQHIKNVR